MRFISRHVHQLLIWGLSNGLGDPLQSWTKAACLMARLGVIHTSCRSESSYYCLVIRQLLEVAEKLLFSLFHVECTAQWLSTCVEWYKACHSLNADVSFIWLEDHHWSLRKQAREHNSSILPLENCIQLRWKSQIRHHYLDYGRCLSGAGWQRFWDKLSTEENISLDVLLWVCDGLFQG